MWTRVVAPSLLALAAASAPGSAALADTTPPAGAAPPANTAPPTNTVSPPGTAPPVTTGAPANTAPPVTTGAPANTAPPPNTAPPANTAPPPNTAPPVGTAPPGALFRPYPSWNPGKGPDASAQSGPTEEEQSQFARKKRALIAGSILFGLGYYFGLVVGSVGVSRNNRGSKEWIAPLVPLVGPFVGAGLRADPNPPQSADNEGVALLIGIGAFQLAGAGLFIMGLRAPPGRSAPRCEEQTTGLRAPCAPPSPVQVSVQPIVTPSFAGAGLTGVF